MRLCLDPIASERFRVDVHDELPGIPARPGRQARREGGSGNRDESVGVASICRMRHFFVGGRGARFLPPER